MSGSFFRALVALLFLGLLTAPVAWADDDDDDDDDAAELTEEFSEDLREDVTLRGIRRHQRNLQRVADRNGGNRASGTSGYDESVDYVVRKLERAGYDVTRQLFDFPFFQELSDPILNQVSPIPTVYTPNVPEGFNSMTYSGSGDATRAIEVVDVVLPPAAEANTSTSGCEAADFAGFTAGNIALVQRGSCSFFLKAQNAQAAGAAGVIIFNEGQLGRVNAINGTLGQPGTTIPTVGAAFAIGDELAALVAVGEDVRVRLAAETVSEIRVAENVLADTHSGNPNQTIVVGAHLDSVGGGPGIQDNGSGSSAILEIAIQLAEYDGHGDDDDDDGQIRNRDGDDDDDDDGQIRNLVRFAWWGAEELGLLGSEFYVANATQAELDQIALNLNFDMIGSPNFVRFIYDGDGSSTPLAGPPGSDHIEQMFINYFVEQGLPVEPTAFSGRSDYGPFIEPGIDIPAGGLFTGAEVAKTQEQADVYGGTVGESFDPCYHLACDDFDNISLEALDQMSDAAAHSVAFYASRDDLFAPIPVLIPMSVTAGTIGMGDDLHDHGVTE